MSSTVSIDELKRFVDLEGKEYRAYMVYTDMDALHESEVYKSIFKGFENRDQRFRETHINKKNWIAYVVDGVIYEIYKIDEGFSILIEVTLGCCISDVGLNEVVSCKDGFIVMNRGWDNTKANRKLFAEYNYTVTTL